MKQARENLKSKTGEIKDLKAELKAKSADHKSLSDKFDRWRARNPDKQLTKAFESTKGKMTTEKLEEYLKAYAQLSGEGGIVRKQRWHRSSIPSPALPLILQTIEFRARPPRVGGPMFARLVSI